MSDDLQDLKRRLVVGHKRDGRKVYDKSAKAELVALCLQPGASVSRLARECQVNANQVGRWLREHAQRSLRSAPIAKPEPAHFVQVPVLPAPSVPVCHEAAPVGAISVQARLPNGVALELQGLPAGQLVSMVQTLGSLRCSASTKG